MDISFITFFYRKPNVNFSIERVFDTILLALGSYVSTRKICVKNQRVTPVAIIKNMFYCLKNRGQINHITGDIHYCCFFLPKKNTILTVHDLILLEKNTGIKKYFFLLFWYYYPVRKVAIVTCISETIKKALLNAVHCDENKLRVIYNPVSNDYSFKKKVFNKNNPIILHIGTRSNKNLERVIEALSSIKCEFRIIGELNKNQINWLNNYKISYSNACNLTDKQIVHEYQKCDIVSFPSTYEGFGMPILEGQATGRVVLTSNIEPMTEIANGGAMIVNPFDVISIRNGFLKLIDDDSLRNNLIKQGLMNINRFSSATIAKQYFQIYNELLKEKCC